MIKFEFNPFEELGLEMKRGEEKRAALEHAADVLKDQILNYMGNATSPVSGHGRFPALTKDYKEKKVAQGGSAIPDLELFGDLKDSIQTYVRGNRIGVKITGKEAKKADGHCNLSGKSELPLRRFIPDDDEMWKRDIMAQIGEAIEEGD